MTCLCGWNLKLDKCRHVIVCTFQFSAVWESHHCWQVSIKNLLSYPHWKNLKKKEFCILHPAIGLQVRIKKKKKVSLSCARVQGRILNGHEKISHAYLSFGSSAESSLLKPYTGGQEARASPPSVVFFFALCGLPQSPPTVSRAAV